MLTAEQLAEVEATFEESNSEWPYVTMPKYMIKHLIADLKEFHRRAAAYEALTGQAVPAPKPDPSEEFPQW